MANRLDWDAADAVTFRQFLATVTGRKFLLHVRNAIPKAVGANMEQIAMSALRKQGAEDVVGVINQFAADIETDLVPGRDFIDESQDTDLR